MNLFLDCFSSGKSPQKTKFITDKALECSTFCTPCRAKKDFGIKCAFLIFIVLVFKKKLDEFTTKIIDIFGDVL